MSARIIVSYHALLACHDRVYESMQFSWKVRFPIKSVSFLRLPGPENGFAAAGGFAAKVTRY